MERQEARVRLGEPRMGLLSQCYVGCGWPESRRQWGIGWARKISLLLFC
jgi:hypothetical protein